MPGSTARVKKTGAHHVHAEHACPLCRFDFEKWCEAADPGAVDEDTSGSKLITDVLVDPLNGRLVRHVTAKSPRSRRVPLARGHNLMQAVGMDVDEGQNSRFAAGLAFLSRSDRFTSQRPVKMIGRSAGILRLLFPKLEIPSLETPMRVPDPLREGESS